MMYTSEVRNPANSDPATTAEEDTYCPNGCEGRQWLQEDRPQSMWLIMPLGYGHLLVKFVRTPHDLRLNNNQLATIISIYAPTLDAKEDTKEQFYSELDLVLTPIPKEDKKIVLGDFHK